MEDSSSEYQNFKLRTSEGSSPNFLLTTSEAQTVICYPQILSSGAVNTAVAKVECAMTLHYSMKIERVNNHPQKRISSQVSIYQFTEQSFAAEPLSEVNTPEILIQKQILIKIIISVKSLEIYYNILASLFPGAIS